MPQDRDLQTLEQKRAAKAWCQVKAVPKDIQKDYRSLVRKMPAMIRINGLGQTLAFLLAQEKKAADVLYKHLEEWLIGNESASSTVEDPVIRLYKADLPWPSPAKETLIERILASDSTVYRLATAEALAYLGWLKRFAEASFGEGG